jgi:hypothetical protein
VLPTESNKLPPNHTIIIESDFRTSTKKSSTVNIKNNRTTVFLQHVGMATSDMEHTSMQISFYAIPRNQSRLYHAKQKMEEKPPRRNGTVYKLMSVKTKKMQNLSDGIFYRKSFGLLT